LWQWFSSLLWGVARESRFKPVSKVGEFCEIPFMGKRDIKSCSVVSELTLGDRELSLGVRQLRLIAPRKSLQGVYDRSWSVCVTGELGETSRFSLKEDLA